MEGATLAEPRIPIRDGIALTYAARSSTLDRPPQHLDVTHRIALLLSAVLLSGCAVVPRSLVTASPSSSSAVGAIGRELGGVALGETQAQVAATLGEPTRKTISHGLEARVGSTPADTRSRFPASNRRCGKSRHVPPYLPEPGRVSGLATQHPNSELSMDHSNHRNSASRGSRSCRCLHRPKCW